jgi:hypothetical protein
MRLSRTIFILLAALIFAAALACSSSDAPKQETPLDTLKAYTQAIKKKDPTTMKLLLSEASLKMAEDEAKAQNTTVDEIIKRETLFTENQTTVEFKNQKIEGERATIEVKNSFGQWDVIPFNKEDGEWKIAKERFMEEQMKKTEEDNKRLDEQINQGFPDAGNTGNGGGGGVNPTGLPPGMNPGQFPPPGGVPDTTATTPTPMTMPTMQEMKSPTP